MDKKKYKSLESINKKNIYGRFILWVAKLKTTKFRSLLLKYVE